MVQSLSSVQLPVISTVHTPNTHDGNKAFVQSLSSVQLPVISTEHTPNKQLGKNAFVQSASDVPVLYYIIII